VIYNAKPIKKDINTQNKLTCPVHAHWLEQSWQYIRMQRQHYNPLLLMSQSKGCCLLKHTTPLLSSQKPGQKII